MIRTLINVTMHPQNNNKKNFKKRHKDSVSHKGVIALISTFKK
jgi:hypothetical protein